MAKPPEQLDPPEAPAVGYGRPPIHSQFKKGHSGNPRGRPKRTRDVESIVNEVLGQKIWVTLDGRRKRVTVHLALLLRLREQGLKGDLRSTRLLLELGRSSAAGGQDKAAACNLSQEDLAILADAGLLSINEEKPDGGA